MSLRGPLRQLWSLLEPSQRRRWMALGPLLVMSGLFETAATAMVFLQVKLAGDPGYALTKEPLATIFHFLGLVRPGSIIVGYGVILAVFFVLRGLIILGTGHVADRVEADTISSLATRLLDSYLHAPFALHLRHSPTELAHDLQHGVERSVTLGMGGAVQITAEVLVGAGLCAFLVAAAPVATLVTAVTLGVLVTVAVRLTKRSSRRWGKLREELMRKTVKSVQQSLVGVREIKVLGREQTFLDAFKAAQLTLAQQRGRHATVTAAPRLAIETIFVCCVVLVVGLVTLRGGGRADVVPLLGVYAYAGFRLIPSANRLMMRLDAMRLAGPAVERVHRLMMLFGKHRTPAGSAAPEPPIGFKDRIVIDGVSFAYEGGAAPVLSDIQATIARGESIGVVGASGAGKSTLIDLVLGLLEPTAGRITVDGTDIKAAPRGWQRHIGYVPQNAYLFDDTIAANIALGVPAAEIDARQLAQATRLAQLDELMASLPDGTQTVIGERGLRLSGGQRQRVAIARALYREPELLIFDEATAALDNQTEREVTRAIEGLKGEKTLIVIAHRLTTVQRCDALLFLKDGRVAARGTYAELVEANPEFRAMAAVVD